MVRVSIFDYGAGNIFSLKNALEQAGAKVDVITSFDEDLNHSGILLPGVGNFDPAIKSIRGSDAGLLKHVGDHIPVLGICLGMEMFFEKSEEGTQDGLSVMDGDVVVLPKDMKVPHMGWNSLRIKRHSKILEGINDGAWVYFVHSFMAKPTSDEIITADSDYGIRIPAIVERDNFIGTQFHPEKSGSVGRAMIKNFLDVCKR